MFQRDEHDAEDHSARVHNVNQQLTEGTIQLSAYMDTLDLLSVDFTETPTGKVGH